jgi:hypothetical protein
MYQSFRSKMRWLALCGALLPASVRADVVAGNGYSPSYLTSAKADASEPGIESFGARSSTQDVDAVDVLPVSAEDILDESEPAAVETFKTSSFASSNSGSTCCDQYCCCSGRRFTPFVGVAAAFLAPVHNRTDTSSLTLTDLGAGTTTTTSANGVNGMIVSPRLWVGVQGERWGTAVRYWRWSDTQGGTQPIIGAPGLGSFGIQSMTLQTLDWEAIRMIKRDNGTMWLSLGARWAQYQSLSNLSNETVIGPAVISTGASAQSSFNGLGITSGISGLRQIPCSNFSLFYSGRTSILWDDNARSISATQVSYVDAVNGSAASANTALTATTGSMFIGELQAGLQYNRRLQVVPVNAFFRTAIEYQYWGLTRNGGARSTSNAGSPFNAFGSASSSAGGATLDLLGFNVATGFYW